MDKVVAEINKAYPGSKRVGAGDVSILRVGHHRLYHEGRGRAGGQGWQWDDGSGGSAADASGEVLAAGPALTP